MEMHMATVWEAVADTMPDTRPRWSTARIGAHGRTTTSERPVSPAPSPTPASAPTPRSACTSTTATSTSRRNFAAFKIRGVPVNVNYRYLDDELWYLLDNADAEALVFHSSLGDRVARVAARAAEAASC